MMLVVGDRAPAFELKDIAGATQPLAEILSGGPAVLVFFKASCPTCQLTMPFVQRLAAGGTRFFAISQDDSVTTRRFISQFGLQLPVLLDPGSASKSAGSQNLTGKGGRYPASNGFQIDHVPSFFAVSAEGIVQNSFTGFVKHELEALGAQAGVNVFREGEKVPALKPG